MTTCKRHCARRGAALLEVLVALTILVVTGAAILGLANEAAGTLRRARAREAEIRRASALFDAVTLWPREDLDRHLGERVQGPWWLRVDRPELTLYTIVLRDSLGQDELLRTAVYRATDVLRSDRHAAR